MIEQYLIDLGKVRASSFKQLYQQALYWIGFNTNQYDKLLRGDEETLLLRLVASAETEQSSELLEVLRPWERHWWDEVGDDQNPLKQALRGKCDQVLLPKVALAAINFITVEGGIRSLWEQGRFAAFKYCLFHPESPIWKGELRSTLLGVISRGRQENSLYHNALEFIDLLVAGKEHGIEFIASRDVAALSRDHEFIRCLWDTVTSRQIQYRMQLKLIRARKVLLESGASESSVPLTHDLQSRIELEQARAQAE